MFVCILSSSHAGIAGSVTGKCTTHRDVQDAAGTGSALHLPLERPEQAVAHGRSRAAQQQARALARRRRPIGWRPQADELVRRGGRVRRNEVLQDRRLEGAPALQTREGITSESLIALRGPVLRTSGIVTTSTSKWSLAIWRSFMQRQSDGYPLRRPPAW